MINKALLLDHIITALESLYQDAFDAAMRAYDTATNDENEAENKYDTLGLEASYLAQGQSKRVIECEADLNAFKKLKINEPDANGTIISGSLIYLLEENNNILILFLGPAAGGLTVKFAHTSITIITPSAPLGRALLGRSVDDEIELKLGNIQKLYSVTNIL